MIGSALRREIQSFTSTASDGRFDRETLARCGSALMKLTRGVRIGASDDGSPSTSLLAALVERSSLEAPEVYLAYRAFGEFFAAQLGLSDADADRAEASLDAIDDIVQDPAELPRLRAQLSRFTDHFRLLCQEAQRAPRRQFEHRVSAA